MLCCLPNAASDKHTYILTYFIVTPSKGFSVTRQIIKTKKSEEITVMYEKLITKSL